MKVTPHPFSHPAADPTDLERIVAESKPRCAATDPTCGPEAYHPERACYDPSAPRVRTEGPYGDRGSEPCAHDGECVLVSVCHACAHYSRAGWVTCGKKWVPYDEEALCGCVRGKCRFFRN